MYNGGCPAAAWRHSHREDVNARTLDGEASNNRVLRRHREGGWREREMLFDGKRGPRRVGGGRRGSGSGTM